MMEFTFAGFIGYTFFIVICTWMLTMAFPKIERKKKGGNKDIYDQPQDEKFKVGGVYGRRSNDDDKNNPFKEQPHYDMYIAVLDIKPSVDGSTKYLQYVFLNDKVMPHKSYSEAIVFSGTIDHWDKWEYIKDIDLDSIVIER